MKHIIRQLISPEQIWHTILAHKLLVIVSILVGLFCGLFRFQIAQSGESRPQYEMQFSLHGFPEEVWKEVFASKQMLSTVLSLSSPAQEGKSSISTNQLANWIDFPSALEPKTNYFILRFTPDSSIDNDRAQKIASTLIEQLPVFLKQSLSEKLPKQKALALYEFEKTSTILPEEFLGRFLQSKNLETCLQESIGNMAFRRVEATVLDSTAASQQLEFRNKTPNAVLKTVVKEFNDGPTASEYLNQWWKSFVSCYQQTSLEQLNNYLVNVVIHGPLPATIAAPYLPSANKQMIADILFPEVEQREIIYHLSGLTFGKFIEANDFMVNPGFNQTESWLSISLILQDLSRTRNVAKFIKKELFNDSPKVILSEQGVLKAKPQVSFEDVIELTPTEVENAALVVIKSPYLKEIVPSPFKFLPTIILFSMIGFFVGISIAVVVEAKSQ